MVYMCVCVRERTYPEQQAARDDLSLLFGREEVYLVSSLWLWADVSHTIVFTWLWFEEQDPKGLWEEAQEAQGIQPSGQPGLCSRWNRGQDNRHCPTPSGKACSVQPLGGRMHQGPKGIHNNGNTSRSNGLLCGAVQVPLLLSSKIHPLQAL